MLFSFSLSDNKSYTCIIRQNKRAKRARLKRTAQGELILTLPKKFYYSKRFLTSLLQSEEAWIMQSLEKFHADVKNENILEPPLLIDFKALGEKYKLTYKSSIDDRRKLTVDNVQNEICLWNIASNEEIQKLLRAYILKKAKKFLQARLEYCMEKYNLSLGQRKLKLSFAKGRWGSCTLTTLSLNARLIFLPIELVDYVIVHELCHVAHLNHSAEYYAFLAQKMPKHKELKQAIHANKLEPYYWAM